METGQMPALATIMRVDVLADKEGGVWILHDQPLAELLKWVDYDATGTGMVLAYADGGIQPLGLVIPPVMEEKLKNFNEISVMRMDQGDVVDFQLVPFNFMSY